MYFIRAASQRSVVCFICVLKAIENGFQPASVWEGVFMVWHNSTSIRSCGWDRGLPSSLLERGLVLLMLK